MGHEPSGHCPTARELWLSWRHLTDVYGENVDLQERSGGSHVTLRGVMTQAPSPSMLSARTDQQMQGVTGAITDV
jgi:hypothetical protein